MAAAVARRKHFTHDYHSKQSRHVVKEYSSSEVEEVRYEYKTEKNIRNVVQRKIPEKYVRESSMIRGPKFLVRLRSHTVFENTPVKLFCTVEGYPTPHVKWFKDDVLIDISSGKYFVESTGGIHCLTIIKCGIDDTAQYTAVAANTHGQASSQAAVIVKRAKDEEKFSPFSWMPYECAILPEIKYTKINISFLEKFDVMFGKEGDCVTLSCKMTINPNLANLQPEAQWYRDEHLLKESKWVKMESGGGVAKLTLTHLAKDDEGLYTLRMVTKGGDAVHKAYVYVEDGPPPVPLAPGAPMDIKIHDANRDYVIVSWKPPNTTTEGPIIGYFVDRCEVGTEDWVQCNDSPIKICKYPVSGLFEGHSYYFRVRAVNAHGISRPSRMSEPIAAVDPTEFERLHATRLGGKLDVVTYHDDLEAEGTAPGAPSNVYASETDRTYVVLSWTPPVYHNRAPMWYYIEKTLAGSNSWQRVNTQVPVRSPRYAVFNLAEGKEYLFRILSANMHGNSEPSKPTAPIKTQELRGVPSAPGQVVATRETDTSVLIQWAPPKEPNNLIGYYIDLCVKGSKNWISANHKPHKKTEFVVHGLKTGETYVFRVQAINELGLSEESQESAPLSVKAALKLPSAPYDIALLHCDGQSMVLSWKRPVSCGGAEVTDYYIDKCNVAKKAWHEVNVVPIKERLYKVPTLTRGAVYQFRVYGANVVGLGEASAASPPFVCEEWNMPEPGPAYDLSVTEIRDDSLVVLWKAPVYSGASTITGYYVDMCKTGTDIWTTVNASAVNHCYLKVKDLEMGSSYVFSVRAENAHGIGNASISSDPACAKALPGAQEIKCGVDKETGDIYLSFESCQITEKSQFVWKKSYEEITDFSKGIVIKTSGNCSTLLFKNPEKEDIGTYSVSVTNTDGASASYNISSEELQKMLALSHDIRHPIIPLKTELAYKILERGRVRLWLQAENISSAVTYKFFANNKELVNCEQTKMRHDVATGIIEMVLDHFTEENEGTFTVQIQDGTGKAQSSLVLIGAAFKAALAEAEYQRREYIRVKEGPHFSQFLSVHVGEDASVSLICKVDNLKKESVFHWFKNDLEVIPDVPADLSSGVCKLPLPLFSKKDVGVYKATISDGRGQDESHVDISGKVFDNIISELSRIAGSSASELVIQCTAEGIMLQCHMKYYTEEMKIHWLHRDAKITASERMRVGGTPAMASLEIVEPTEKDKGVYTFVMTDTEKMYTRTLELSGQVYDNAYAEFQKLKAEAYAEKNRGKVIGGLPDVATIMEKKTLSLTCTVCGDPKPQITWFKNDQEVEPGDQYVISLDSSKFASLTIKGVSLDDSGKFTMCVQNRYGGESADVIVSVYKHGDKIPDIKPSPAPKKILPPTQPIVLPTPKASSPTPAPAPAKTTGVKSTGMKSPVPSRRK
ncbi:myomesin-2 [Pangasianodon hypophthalmus]|uniref:myomesin-2 n=1 Tax=Pangasianodon hypophthalmus TaxID=310915 RepID=UPI0023080B45|nr:myomesin-2 [Pangasianodon hypophthalmus]XP_053088611.1 myomesin-2 [Pangasianodon hypophthalmus]XP_053088612.1 myomesin-2 [Pangasianodon hypophthalmus]XP_053088613.1 myomesin-2 [Pangasianodon hypophthalmus]